MMQSDYEWSEVPKEKTDNLWHAERNILGSKKYALTIYGRNIYLCNKEEIVNAFFIDFSADLDSPGKIDFEDPSFYEGYDLPEGVVSSSSGENREINRDSFQGFVSEKILPHEPEIEKIFRDISEKLKYYEGELDKKYNANGKQIKYGNGYLAVEGVSFEFEVTDYKDGVG